MIDVLLIEKHPLFVIGMYHACDLYPQIRIVADAHDKRKGAELAEQLRPQLIVSENQLQPHLVAQWEKQLHYAPKILLLIDLSEFSAPLIQNMLKIQANGYISKNTSYQNMFAAMHCLISGAFYFDQAIHHMLQLNAIGTHCGKELSEREYQIARMMIFGLSAKEIGNRLSISHKTVNSYRYRIFAKWRISNNIQFIEEAFARGLISENEIFFNSDFLTKF